MKKTILIFGVIVFSTGITAQAKKGREIPQSIAVAFSSKYSAAKVTKWTQNDSIYMAEFFLDKKKQDAFYSPDGKWIRTEIKIRWSWKLPKAVRDSFFNSEFASYYIHGIKEVQTPSDHFYKILVNDGFNLDSNHQGLAQDYIVYFNPDGTLIKKEAVD